MDLLVQKFAIKQASDIHPVCIFSAYLFNLSPSHFLSPLSPLSPPLSLPPLSPFSFSFFLSLSHFLPLSTPLSPSLYPLSPLSISLFFSFSLSRSFLPFLSLPLCLETLVKILQHVFNSAYNFSMLFCFIFLKEVYISFTSVFRHFSLFYIIVPLVQIASCNFNSSMPSVFLRIFHYFSGFCCFSNY